MSNKKKEYLLFVLLIFSVFMHRWCLAEAAPLMKGKITNLIPACEQGDYITLDELYDCCGIPGVCFQEMECEKKFALIEGYISYVNIWNKREYSWLPHSKFMIYNAERNINVEVRMDSDDADMIFEKIREHSGSPDDPVYIKGKLVGVDMPAMETCHRNLEIFLYSGEAIFFGKDIDIHNGSTF